MGRNKNIERVELYPYYLLKFPGGHRKRSDCVIAFEVSESPLTKLADWRGRYRS